jgi:hypothetical protein
MDVKIVARQDDETIICLLRWVDPQTYEWLTVHVTADATLEETGPIPKFEGRGAPYTAIPKSVELRAIVAAQTLVRRFERALFVAEPCNV